MWLELYNEKSTVYTVFLGGVDDHEQPMWNPLNVMHRPRPAFGPGPLRSILRNRENEPLIRGSAAQNWHNYFEGKALTSLCF